MTGGPKNEGPVHRRAGRGPAWHRVLLRLTILAGLLTLKEVAETPVTYDRSYRFRVTVSRWEPDGFGGVQQVEATGARLIDAGGVERTVPAEMLVVPDAAGEFRPVGGGAALWRTPAEGTRWTEIARRVGADTEDWIYGSHQHVTVSGHSAGAALYLDRRTGEWWLLIALRRDESLSATALRVLPTALFESSDAAGFRSIGVSVQSGQQRVSPRWLSRILRRRTAEFELKVQVVIGPKE